MPRFDDRSLSTRFAHHNLLRIYRLVLSIRSTHPSRLSWYTFSYNNGEARIRSFRYVIFLHCHYFALHSTVPPSALASQNILDVWYFLTAADESWRMNKTTGKNMASRVNIYFLERERKNRVHSEVNGGTRFLGQFQSQLCFSSSTAGHVSSHGLEEQNKNKLRGL